MFVAKRFILKVVVEHGEHPVSTDGGTCGIWYPQDCKFLKIEHHIHILLLKKAL